MKKSAILSALFSLFCALQSVVGDNSRPLILVVSPDTAIVPTLGDSIVLHARIVDWNSVALREYDSLIHWQLSNFSTGGRLRTLTGSDNTYYAEGSAYRSYFIIVRFTDPNDNSFVLIDSIPIFIKPDPVFRVYIEPDTLINLNGTGPNRLIVPDPVDSLVFQGLENIKTLAAVRRDVFGNFVGFDTSVTWQESGNGIVKVSAPDRPYLCVVEKIRAGTSSIYCLQGDMILGEVKVIAKDWTKAMPLEALSRYPTAVAFHKYYNLRGQKLLGFGSARADGIVIERIIEPGGKVSMKKTFKGTD